MDFAREWLHLKKHYVFFDSYSIKILFSASIDCQKAAIDQSIFYFSQERQINIYANLFGRNNVPSYIISVFGAEHSDLPHRTYVEPWANKEKNSNFLISLISKYLLS